MKKILTLFTALILFGSMAVKATTYYYRGNQNGWGASAMVASTDGYYAYFESPSHDDLGDDNKFKITTSTDWNSGSEYSCWYANPGFNNTDVTDMNNSTNTSGYSNNDWNNVIHSDVAFYILFYFPGTTINPSSNPIICASTTRPDDSSIPPTPDTYTVVGTVPGLDWDPTNDANDMTEDNGVYTFTLTNVELAANNSYQYKIAKNHSWTNPYPAGDNASFQVTVAGIYDVTFTLDLSATPEYSVTPTLIQPAVVIPTVVMNGTFGNGTDWASTAEFTVASGNESAILTLENLPAGNYEFKVIVGSSWLGNGHTFYRDYTGASNIGDGGNMTLEADVTGDYTFTWTYETSALSIEFPAEPTPEYVTVKFFAPRDETNKWEHVYAYSFKGSRKFLGEWPGTEITSTKNDGWYEVSVRKGSNLIFTDNAGMQTSDLDIQAAVCYESTSIYYPTDPADAKIVTVTPNANCAVQYYIAGSKTLFGGEADWAINLPLDANNEIVFQNVEPGTYAFKINNNTWAWSIGGYANLSDEEGCGTIAVELEQGNIGFTIGTKQDVTISYNPTTQKICLGAVTVKTTPEVTADDMNIEAGESKSITYWTNNTESPAVTFSVVSGAANINLNGGVILGIKAGEATVRVSVAETANYTAASKDFTVTVTTPIEPAIAPIAPIGGKFTINAKGDTAIFARGNLQYQQSSNTWRCAPNQYEWKGTDNLQMGNSAYEGWVDLFCWSIGAENNYGATSAYLTTTYFNKSFVDWGGLFSDTYEWSTLSINEWYYLLYSRANANNLWGMAMIGDNLGMIILPDEWTAPSGVTFVPGTIPTTDLFAEGDCLDPTMADQDHWRLNPDNLPANKFTVADWEILEAAGAVFLPYGGRRSGGYGNHTNRQDQTIAEEYAYAYYENYYGSYWTSTVAKPAEGKSYWLPLICGGCNDANENWGRGSHGWWENGRYGHSVRLVTRIPKVEWTEVRTGLTAGNYYTLCNAKAMTAIKGGTLWSFAGKDEQLAYIVQEDAPFEAGKPYLIYAESDKLEALLEGSDAPASDYNGLFGTLANMDNAALLAAGATHLLKNNELHPVGAGTLRAGRAYIKAGELPNGKPSNAPAHKVRSMPMQRDAAQGIEDVQGDNVQSTKVLINGNLYILRGENVYDATGRLVK